MVLSQDAACYIDWIDPNVLPFLPQWHYLHIHDEVLPYAREHGVTARHGLSVIMTGPRLSGSSFFPAPWRQVRLRARQHPAHPRRVTRVGWDPHGRGTG
jgi:hypothetical protein